MYFEKNAGLPSDSVDPEARRKVMEEPVDTQADSDHENVLSQTNLEQSLLKIWKELLEGQNVCIHDNFFDLGGHSLLAVDLLAQIHQHFRIELPVRKIYESPTIFSLAKEIESVLRNVPQSERLAELKQPWKKTSVEGMTPLTPLQAWHLNRWDELIQPDRRNISRLLEVDSNFDPAKLQQVLTYLWEVHDILRAYFIRNGDEWRQIIAGPGKSVPDFREYNLANLPVEDEERIMDEYAELFQGSINLTYGPLMIVAYFNLGPTRPGRLMLIASHLLLDGNSITILIKDLQTAYNQLRAGNPIALPESSLSIKEWSELLHKYLLSDQHRKTIDYWLAMPWDEVPYLPIDFPQNRGQNLISSTAKITVSLTEDETNRLTRKVPLVLNLEVENVLLWALTKVISEWTGSKLVEIQTMGNGHDLIPNQKYLNLSRTLGWLATFRTMILENIESADLLQEISLFCGQIKKIPDNGYGYHLLLAFNNSIQLIKQLRKVKKGEILFNYRGLIDQVNIEEINKFKLVRQSCGINANPRNNRLSSFYIPCDIINHCLTFVWEYSDNLFRRETVERLAEKYINIIKDFITKLEG
jgi:non-ribosomal peptide synthase protein (TIGR01720 family)